MDWGFIGWAAFAVLFVVQIPLWAFLLETLRRLDEMDTATTLERNRLRSQQDGLRQGQTQLSAWMRELRMDQSKYQALVKEKPEPPAPEITGYELVTRRQRR